MADGDDNSGAVTADQFALLMNAIKSSKETMEGKMEALKTEMKKNQEATEVVVKNVKRSRPPEFKRKGNEQQFIFNDQVVEKLESAVLSLEGSTSSASSASTVTALEGAKASVKEGMDLLNNRQKLIRLADRSDFGWEVVNVYQSDELAEDSDDEKRISKAEKVAEQKILKRKKSAGKSSKSRFQFTKPKEDWKAPKFGGGYTPQPWNPRSTGGTSSSRSPRIGPCFTCGEFGHLKETCRRNYVYPLNIGDSCKVLSGEFSTCEPNELAILSKRCWESDGQIPGVKGRLRLRKESTCVLST